MRQPKIWLPAINEVTHLQGIIIATWAIALMTVCLRFFARRLSKAGLWYDDWLMIPATIFATVLCFISAVWMVNISIALDDRTKTTTFTKYNGGLENVLKASFISQICWMVALWAVKCSMLAFYWRLFSGNGRIIRVVVWTITAAVVCWGTAILFIMVFQCSPIDALRQWPSGCDGSPTVTVFGYTLSHIMIDAVLLIFPMPLVWNIQVGRSQKVMLFGVFALGGFVTVVSGVRLGFFFELSNNNTAQPPFLLTNIEINTSIICACLPSLGPILTLVSTTIARIRQHRSTHKRGSSLLRHMLPVFKAAKSTQVLPLARRPSWDDGPNPMRNSLPIVEAEANPHVPELDAEAPGPHILEIETVEPTLAHGPLGRVPELDTQGPIPELEGVALRRKCASMEVRV